MLPKEPVEWRRSYGRPARTVQVEANFVPFNPDIIPTSEDWGLLGRPFFHTYWTDCNIDVYKSTVREDIADWLATLKRMNVSDWMIIVIVHEESKVKATLLRTSVLDKVKSDFCNKQTDRCAQLSDPFKHDLRTGESWFSLLHQMRELMLHSYNAHLCDFEEHMRAQRERRNESNWRFSKYFLLQEELAFMYEMLGLCEDALVQYDELDALFTQFILNHAAGDTADWLTHFTSQPQSRWDGLCLSQPINIDKRQLIKRDQASLLDLRDYLFSRQATILFLLQRPVEVAERSIAFLHNCVQEIDLLGVTLPVGALACWVFLTCLEVLQSIDSFNLSKVSAQREAKDSEVIATHSVHTASLWDYARGKMHVLGTLCGLMPKLTPNSEQLNIVVQLIAGLTQVDDECKVDSKPQMKLREALSSKESFRCHFLELSELAMGTYKHIGRLRSARIIGKYLAEFYMELGEAAKAEMFLIDAMKMYKSEGWYYLSDHTRLKLAECQKTIQCDRFLRTCMHVASSRFLPMATREKYQQEFISLANQINEDQFVKCKPVIYVSALTPASPTFVLSGECRINVTLTCDLPQPITCQRITLALTKDYEEIFGNSTPQSTDSSISMTSPFKQRHLKRGANSHKRIRPRTASETSTNDLEYLSAVTTGMKYQTVAPNVLKMSCRLDKDVNNTVISSSLICQSQIKRNDSSTYGSLREKEQELANQSEAVRTENIVLQPGDNQLCLTGNLSSVGTYYPTQLCVSLSHLHLLKSLIQADVHWNVTDDATLIHVPQQNILGGIEQNLSLEIDTGGYHVCEGDTITFTPSDGLHVLDSDNVQDGRLVLPAIDAHTIHKCDVKIYAELPSGDMGERQLEVSCDWRENETHSLEIQHPLKFEHKLHTANKRKYLQLLISSLTTLKFSLCDATLTCKSPDVEIVSLNPQKSTMIIDHDRQASYVWQVKVNTPDLMCPVPCDFSVQYTSQSEPPNGNDNSQSDSTNERNQSESPKHSTVESVQRLCRHQFTLENYQTLYEVRSTISPYNCDESCDKIDESCRTDDESCRTYDESCRTDDESCRIDDESCRIGEMCKLSVHIRCTRDNPGAMLMYDIDTDDGQWVVVGKNSGIFELEGTEYTTEVDIMPLVPGYLHLPRVRILHKNTTGFQPFEHGQVYNHSAAKQIQVLPMSNTTHVDLVIQQ